MATVLKRSKLSPIHVCEVLLKYFALRRVNQKPKVAVKGSHIKEGQKLHCWLFYSIEPITLEWLTNKSP